VLKSTHDALGEVGREARRASPFEPASTTRYRRLRARVGALRRTGTKVLVDTGITTCGHNTEQIVAWLMHFNALGGFSPTIASMPTTIFTLGLIDPHQAHRIFS